MWKFNKFDPEKDGSLTGNVGDKELAKFPDMIREGVQNSMDAIPEDSHKPVKIKIGLSQIKTEDLHSFLFKEPKDKEHFEKTDEINLCQESNVGILKFEDFNTTGIKGKIQDNNSDLWAFVNHEQVENQNKDLSQSSGSRGVGKSAFIYASNYLCYFFSTKNAECTFHLGRAYLKSKRHIDNDDNIYTKDSYFTNDGKIKCSLDGEILAEFNRLFSINRQSLGTSIVVISPKVNIDIFKKETIKSVVENYYFLFIEKKLLLEINVPHQEPIIINHKNIQKLMADIFDSDFIDFIDCMYHKQQELEKIIFPVTTGEVTNLKLTDKCKDNFLQQYNSGQSFKIVFPFEYYKQNIKENLIFYIQKNSSITKVKNIHLRRANLLITKDAKSILRRVKESMYIGVKITKDCCPNIHKILRNLEDNAHTTWGTVTKPNTLENNLRLAIQRHIPNLLLDILQQEENDEIITLDYLSEFIPSSPKTKKHNRSQDGEKTVEPPPTPPPPPPQKDIHISQISGGFKIYAQEYKENNKIQILCAYQQEDKSKQASINEYRDFHFDVSDLDIELQGAVISVQETNFIELIDIQEQFSMSITGFDSDYDLTFRIKEIENA